MAVGKAKIEDATDGFVKVVADEKYGEILGVHMIGGAVTEMIAEAVAAMALEGTVDDLVNTIHAHPTLAEGMHEAMENVFGAGDSYLTMRQRPDWLKVRIPSGETFFEVRRILRSHKLNTICEDAMCPNIAECWGKHRTATFMILGRHLHARLRVLCRHERQADRIRSAGTRARRCRDRRSEAEACRDHFRRSRRSGGWRRVDLRRNRPTRSASSIRT